MGFEIAQRRQVGQLAIPTIGAVPYSWYIETIMFVLLNHALHCLIVLSEHVGPFMDTPDSDPDIGEWFVRPPFRPLYIVQFHTVSPSPSSGPDRQPDDCSCKPHYHLWTCDLQQQPPIPSRRRGYIPSVDDNWVL